MRARALLLLVLLTFSLHARTRAVRIPQAPTAPASVLWIAAHPDDEAVVAPLLAYWCRDLSARCAMLVLTRGEAGPCLLPDGCHPDIRTVRSAEHAAATAYFGADSILLSLPDGGGVESPSWREASGPDIVSTIANYIEAVRPDTILTFDPRHGTTCHPDHRETGRIVLEALPRLTFSPALYLLQTRVAFDSFGGLRFFSASPNARRFDATQILASSGEPAWNAVIDDMRRHPSQFDASWIAAVEAVPAHDRAVFIAGPDVLQRPVDDCE